MADGTKIEWTDATWNIITGCSVVSPGCTNCYAMRLAGTRHKHLPSRAGLTRDTKAGPVWTGEVRFNEEWLDQPLRWRRPRKIFVCAHGDLFAEGVPDEWLDRIFAVMALCPQHVFQVLTKRPERMRAYFAGRRNEFGRASDALETISNSLSEDANQLAADRLDYFDSAGICQKNIWLGVSVEDQRRADERIPVLLDTPAAVRWISAEPLLGPINLNAIREDIELHGGGHETRWESCLNGKQFDIWSETDIEGFPKLDWVVAGGESGPGARPMHPDWARSLRDQCAAAGVPFLFKQWGAWGPGAEFTADISARRAYRGEIQTLEISGSPQLKLCIPTRDDDALGPALTLERLGKKAAGRLLDGLTHDGFPEVCP
ncbi:phage Gp37/Gp68 family protein [Hansschlegelia sp.]|uniref:phage Gp37/Gp68 family protein n=1 Tax=Hansschlegelia sp. TaxID=2041892 RepID=UPI002C2371F3|nr:phage Gp37/Gp68 family protein [Hansschlegelia sp.]HVI27491.1 phage Gp37/Gp68 family protein [Hansschlegelia sp.]